MDDYSGKNDAISKKGSGPILRDTSKSRNQHAQSCNRIGCSGRMNTTKGTPFGRSENPKLLRPLFRSSTGKEIVGSSSRTFSTESVVRSSIKGPREKRPSQFEANSPVTTSLYPDLGKKTNEFQHDPECTSSSESSSNEACSSSVTPGTRKHSRNFIRKSGSDKKSTVPASSVSMPPKSTSQPVKLGTSTSKYGLRNFKCNSIEDVIPSELKNSKKKVAVTKRNFDGESSSFFKGKKRIEPSLERRQNSNLSSGISISDSRLNRNWLRCEDNGNSSLRSRRVINGNPRISLPGQGNRINLSQNESPIMIGQMDEPEVPIIVNGSSSSHQISADSHSRSLIAFSRQGSSSSDSSHSRFSLSPSEVGINRALVNQDNFQRYNMNGIAGVLLALERLEQDAELSYEQLLALETNLIFNGLSFHDQHREMRLDIDNMSYEELLALEDKMGNVSTALTEDELEKCLKSSIYESIPEDVRTINVCGDDKNDDIKCSICQEEYVEGDELGRLVKCEHGYHLECIHQWLRLKNWCPICKLSAASSPSPS